MSFRGLLIGEGRLNVMMNKTKNSLQIFGLVEYLSQFGRRYRYFSRYINLIEIVWEY